VDFPAAHQFGSLDSRRYGTEGGFDVDYYALAESCGGSGTYAGNFYTRLAAFSYNRAYLGRAYIKADN
jgi:hypothetical protein